MGQVVGFTNLDDQGQEGLELAYDQWLRGKPGSKRVIRDRLGRVVEDVESLWAPEPGHDLLASLDRRLQYLAHRALKAAVKRHAAAGGTLVLMDSRTGEVLSMVNQPAYNPNNRAERSGARARNRAITDLFEPGSTVKPFTVAVGLESGLFRPETLIETAPGTFRVGRLTVRDIHDYGTIDVRTLIKKSSNVGATKMALAVPRESLWRGFARLGFGAPSGSSFPGEAVGVLTDPRRWGEVHRATLSYGYGLSVTALQLARAYGVLASDGLLRPVTLLRVPQEVSGERVMPAGIARELRSMMEMVTEDGGTATKSRVPGYRVAGKTGTVKKSAGGGYAHGRYLSVFAGLAPASAPRLVMVVVIDEPGGKDYYGGLVAAPVFAEVMAGALRILGVPPDDLDGAAPRVALAPDPQESRP
jgi:cell division protein FtsI (penicillin-binding protein 3)